MRTLLALCCCIALGAQAETFSARVIAVMDGDTVMVLRDGEKIKIRLANIDAPEVGHAGMDGKPPNSQEGQAFGQQARDSLLEMVNRKQVQVDSQAVDQYGRIVGLLSVDGRNVNQEQLKRGMAWEYSHFHSDKTYIGLQSEAQQARRGLWSQNDPQPPWEWRKSHPSVKPDAQTIVPAKLSPAAPVTLYDMACGKKRHCSQMNSCDEAYFYFTKCGVKMLDANHNGKPCETLCVGEIR